VDPVLPVPDDQRVGGQRRRQQLHAADSTSSTDGLNLTAPVIAGNARSKFVVNATGKVGSDAVSCGMNPPVFGFQKLP
jgi:hypothetical protein